MASKPAAPKPATKPAAKPAAADEPTVESRDVPTQQAGERTWDPYAPGGTGNWPRV